MTQNMAAQPSLAGNPGAGTCVPSPAGVASLLPFTPRLQEAIITAVMTAVPQRGTDIWYKDKASGAVFVMRHGVQWQLNETGSVLWERLGHPVKAMVEELCKQYSTTDPDEIRFHVVEFLLNADSHGLVELFPELPAGKPKA